MAKNKTGWWRSQVRRVTHAEDQTDAQRRRAPWVFAAFILALALVGASVWAVRVFWFEPAQTQPTSSASAAPSDDSPLPPEGAGVPAEAACTLDSTQADISAAPPNATRWVVESQVVIPEVAGAGPCVEHDGFRTGFAQTQTGALLAAYYYGATLVVNDPTANTPAQADYALVAGPLKDSIVQRINDVQNGVEVRADAGRKATQEFSGYRIVSYTGEAAVVELLLTRIDGSAAVGALVKLAWMDGDWRIDPAGPTEWASPNLQPRLSDYVQWNQRS